MSVSCFGIELPSNRCWLRKGELHALRGNEAGWDRRAVVLKEFPACARSFFLTAKRKFLMRYLFCPVKMQDGFADRTTMQSTYKVDDVAMLATAKVVPLVTFGIDFEGGCALIAKRRAVPIVNALYLYSCWRIALLLQIIDDGDLFDVLYFHCDFVLS